MKYTYQEIKESVESSLSMNSAAKKLKMSPVSFRRIAMKYGLYRPNMAGKGIPNSKPRADITPLDEILEGKHPKYQTNRIKKRLIEIGILRDECSECGWAKKIPGEKFSTCELHHIDGNNKNHKIENLKILCPNCHSLTPNYRFREGKNNGRVVERSTHQT